MEYTLYIFRVLGSVHLYPDRTVREEVKKGSTLYMDTPVCTATGSPV
jgi:hypothetical protein